MKKILILMIGLLLIGVNAYSAGDLIVNGKLGVGTTPTNAKINIMSTTQNFGVSLTQTRDTTGPSWGASFFGFLDGTTTTYSDEAGGFMNTLVYRRQSDSDSGSSLYAGLNSALIGTTGGTGFTVDNVTGLLVKNGMHSGFNSTMTLTNAYGIISEGLERRGAGSLTVDDFRHIYIQNRGVESGTATLSVTNQSGLWIDNQALGSVSRGIVLNGNGAGSDIVFGLSQEARIYSSGGELFAQDGASNVTQISPHDPVTGEWIFYSKNVKTGKVVKVNMEKLVKAVEKLTGDKFMIETMVEGK